MGASAVARVISATADLADAHDARARALFADDRYEAAVHAWAAALRLEPGRMDRLRAMGAAFEAKGESEMAMSCYRNTVPADLDRRCFAADVLEGRLRRPRSCEGVMHHSAHDESPLLLQEPRGNRPAAHYPEFRRRRTGPAGAFVSELTNGELWFDGFNTLVMNADRDVLDVQSRGNLALALDAIGTRSPQWLSGTVCFLDARSGSNYYHWLLDVVPKLALLPCAGVDPIAVDHWVVRCDTGFQRETLSRLGVDLSRVRSFERETHVVGERLIVPRLKNDIGERPSRALGMGMGRWLPRWLRAQFVDESDRRDNAAGARLYIARPRGASRSVDNDAAFTALLAERGFQRVELDGMSVSEQARLLAGADVVLAVHGAALANLVFCRPATRVIELFDDYVVPCYWALASIAGLEYRRWMNVSREPVESSGRSEVAASRAADVPDRRDARLQIDLEAFERWLDLELPD